MPPDGAVLAAARPRRHLHAVTPSRLSVVDVAMFYGARSGGIRTYLDEKARYAALSGAYEHHLVVPGEVERRHSGRHELSSLRVGVGADNGYRVPLGTGALNSTLRELAPDVVLLHDPFWASRAVIKTARENGAVVVAVHHASTELSAAGFPGPTTLYRPLLRAWLRHAYHSADAIMSFVDPRPDVELGASVALRFGVHEAFQPHDDVPRGGHVLYVGRIAREKGIYTLLAAAAGSAERWPLVFIGSGHAVDTVASRGERLGLDGRVRLRSFIADRRQLARAYASASAVVLPGPHETFGLVALEAAASGARVVTCSSTPAARVIGSLASTFTAGDPASLLAAIEHARAQPRNLSAARALARRFSWERAFAAELRDLERLVR